MPRRRRTLRYLRRREPVREPYARILIVCEGEKTEPTYFSELRNAYRLSTANIKIIPGRDSAPITVVDTAIEAFKADPDYDEVYVLIDRDQHVSFEQALARVAQPPRALRGKLRAIVSWPCFEYWLLLHFGYSARPERTCNNVIRALRDVLSTYEKGTAGLFAQLEDRLEAAVSHSERRARDVQRTGARYPSTDVHVLIRRLLALKAERDAL